MTAIILGADPAAAIGAPCSPDKINGAAELTWDAGWLRKQLVEDRRNAETRAAEATDELGYVVPPSSVTITGGFANPVIMDRGRKVPAEAVGSGG